MKTTDDLIAYLQRHPSGTRLSELNNAGFLIQSQVDRHSEEDAYIAFLHDYWSIGDDLLVIRYK